MHGFWIVYYVTWLSLLNIIQNAVNMRSETSPLLCAFRRMKISRTSVSHLCCKPFIAGVKL